MDSVFSTQTSPYHSCTILDLLASHPFLGLTSLDAVFFHFPEQEIDWGCFICCFSSSEQSDLYLRHPLYYARGPLCICELYTCGCVHVISCSVSLCLFSSLSCMCDRLVDWLCARLPEWNVSLISLLLLEGRKGGLYPVISASPWPPLSPRCTREHTQRLLNILFTEYSITTRTHFVLSACSCCDRHHHAAGEGWQMVWLKASRKEHLIDWLIVMVGLRGCGSE